MSGLLLHSCSASTPMFGGIGKLKNHQNRISVLSSNKFIKPSMPGCNSNNSSRNAVKGFFFNPAEDPLLKEALKEPVAFAGGLFAGLLRLDLNEDPLKEWVTRTVESAGVMVEIDTQGSALEEGPTEIEIE